MSTKLKMFFSSHFLGLDKYGGAITPGSSSMSSSSGASSSTFARASGPGGSTQFPPLNGQQQSNGGRGGAAPSSSQLIRPGTRDSLYDRLIWLHQHDEDSQKELNMGKRIGFYKLKSDLGTGNFSKVKLATHQLTKGRRNTSLEAGDSKKSLYRTGFYQACWDIEKGSYYNSYIISFSNNDTEQFILCGN